jgi:hypothetical protein
VTAAYTDIPSITTSRTLPTATASMPIDVLTST